MGAVAVGSSWSSQCEVEIESDYELEPPCTMVGLRARTCSTFRRRHEGGGWTSMSSRTVCLSMGSLREFVRRKANVIVLVRLPGLMRVFSTSRRLHAGWGGTSMSSCTMCLNSRRRRACREWLRSMRTMPISLLRIGILGETGREVGWILCHGCNDFLELVRAKALVIRVKGLGLG